MLHADEISAYRKRYRIEKPEKVAEDKKRWAQDNPEKVRMIRRRWKKKNPDKVREATQKRLATKKERMGACEPKIQDMLLEQRWSCHYCGIDLHGTGYHEEHKIPLSRGGLHDKSNVCLSCPTCNHKKGILTAEEFLALPKKENQP